MSSQILRDYLTELGKIILALTYRLPITSPALEKLFEVRDLLEAEIKAKEATK